MSFDLSKSSQKIVRSIIHIEVLLGVLTIFGAFFYRSDFNYLYLIPAGVFAIIYIPFAFSSKSKMNDKFGKSLSVLTRKFEVWSIGNEEWLKWVPLASIYGILLIITILIEMISIFFMFATVSFLVWFFRRLAEKK